MREFREVRRKDGMDEKEEKGWRNNRRVRNDWDGWGGGYIGLVWWKGFVEEMIYKQD